MTTERMEPHTPGPWQAICRHVSYEPGQTWGKEEFLQWEVEGPEHVRWGRGDYYQADALLIAAAPDLLAALRAMMYDEDRDDAEHKARAAITKATTTNPTGGA